jgi:hypothetical protein
MTSTNLSRRLALELSEKSIKVSHLFNQQLVGICTKTNEECAVKLEPAKTKFPQLYYEAKLYKIFNGAG